MERTKLRKKFRKIDLLKTRFAYKQQRCKIQLKYLKKLNQKNFTDYKLFWNKMKPFFLDRGTLMVK